MKKLLSLFLLFFIFSCTSSDDSTLYPNNKELTSGSYYGKLTVTLSAVGSPDKVLESIYETIIVNDDYSIYADIFDKDTIPAGTLKRQSYNTYYGNYIHSSIGTIYTIKIKIVDSSTISVDILATEPSSKNSTSYKGNLSKE